jgi:hypothetical protein
MDAINPRSFGAIDRLLRYRLTVQSREAGLPVRSKRRFPRLQV